MIDFWFVCRFPIKTKWLIPLIEYHDQDGDDISQLPARWDDENRNPKYQQIFRLNLISIIFDLNFFVITAKGILNHSSRSAYRLDCMNTLCSSMHKSIHRKYLCREFFEISIEVS